MVRREQIERIEQLADDAVAAGGVPGIVVQIRDADTDSTRFMRDNAAVF